MKRMLYEYGPQADKFKSEALGKRKDYYYLWFIATRPEKQGQRESEPFRSGGPVILMIFLLQTCAHS